MTTVKMEIELSYDETMVHGDDEQSKQWFFGHILNGNTGELMLHSNDIGDTIGSVKVIRVLAL